MKKQQDAQYVETNYISPKGNEITVCRPILTPEEREHRERIVRKAMCKFLEARIKADVPFSSRKKD